MSELLSKKMDRSIIGALLTGHAQEEWNELKAEAVALEEKLEDTNSDRLQLLKAVQFGVESLPETAPNIKARARLEMSLTDLIIAIAQEEKP